jgi:hypothetical protein
MDMNSFNGVVIKGRECGENELWGLASVECKDRDGDIVRIAGIDLSMHRAESPIKVGGASHSYRPLSDGTHPVMGLVKEFAPTTWEAGGASCKALAFRMEYAKEADGSLTPYAAKMKSLYDAGTLDSFSIGFELAEHKPFKGGRYDITKSRLVEISACALPVNPYCTVMKALKSTLGDDFCADELIEEKLIAINKSLAFMERASEKYGDRLDGIESSVAALSDALSRATSGRKIGNDDEMTELAKAISKLQSLLK